METKYTFVLFLVCFMVLQGYKTMTDFQISHGNSTIQLERQMDTTDKE